MNFFSCFLQMLLLLCAPPFVLGAVAWALQWLYGTLVGDEGAGRPLMLATTALSTPLREIGHVLACMLCLHRVEEFCLLDVQAPEGEWGFVEHSYNPRNPIAIFGNFLYALAPCLLGLLAVLILFSTCFYGVLPSFFEEIGRLGEEGAGFGAYVKAAFLLIPAMFTQGEAPMLLRIVGCVLLLGICSGIHVSPAEIADAVGGFLIFTVPVALVSGILMLLDERALRLAFSGLHALCAGVIALFSVVLLCLAALVALGLAFGVLRTLFSRGEAGGEV